MRSLLHPTSRSAGQVARWTPRPLVVFALTACALASGVLSPRYATAEATHSPEAVAGPSGLPDGRVYEQVSPKNKHGNEVLNHERPAFVSPDGQGVFYGASGGLTEGASNSVVDPSSISQRTSHGWVTRSALPLPAPGPESPEENIQVGTLETLTVPSADLSHVLFQTWNLAPYVGPPDQLEVGLNTYLTGPNTSVEPEWLGRSLFESGHGGGLVPVGASPNLTTIYLYAEVSSLPASASHLYEYKLGVLSEIGALPGAETSTSPALPAAEPELLNSRTLISAAAYDNQVSADGSRIFFVRQDEAGTWELYARIAAPDGSHSTVLVSQSQLPGHVGEPAPTGPVKVASTERQADTYYAEYGGATSPPYYAFASPDGTHVFFQSTDRLTAAAPEDSAVKTYVFDVDTGTLEYLPGLTGSIVTVSDDGSSAVFENTASTPFHLERWAAGPGGGSVTQIASLPEVSRNICAPVDCIGPAETSNDGSVVVFSTDSPIAGFNDGGSHYTLNLGEGGEEPVTSLGLYPNYEIFRYDANSNELACLSCPPKGVTPSGNAIMSDDDDQFNSLTATGGAEVLSPGRGASTDGSRAFFQTRDALVPQDTNGTIDVYEWEGGSVYLISSGHSPEPSYFTGVSDSGGDAFFMTSEGISPGDVDGSYDVYDARIPRPGDNPPPEAVPCSGSVCQGPPSVPQLLGEPASEAFNGAGNLTPALSPPGGVVSKSLTRAQKLARALKACKRLKGAGKRKSCERQARHKYGAQSARARRAGGQAHRSNGRGK